MARVPGMHNGGSRGPAIPSDLPFPCIIYQCSGDIEHASSCDGTCETWEPSEIQVKLQNLQREYGRNSMSAIGIPKNVPVPISGIQVDLVELLCRIIALEEMVFELVGMDREEFDDKYLETKFEFLNDVLESNKEHVRKTQVAGALGIIERPGLLGPNGEPIG